MSLTLLIAAQFVLVMAIAIAMLLLVIRRQKKTIQQLKSILTTVKDDISGEDQSRYLQLEIDDTTAHCRQDTVAISAELEAVDMAISIRFASLQAELALMQDRVGSTNTPWREKIKAYNVLAETLCSSIQQQLEKMRNTLTEVHAEEMGRKQARLDEAETQLADIKHQWEPLKPLFTLLKAVPGDATASPPSRDELELQLYQSLLGLCETLDNSEALREVVFQLHEGFNSAPQNSQQAKPQPAEKKAGVGADNSRMLNNIIDNQNQTIQSLRQQIKALEQSQTRDQLLQSVEVLEESVRESADCLQSMESTTDMAELESIIIRFTEDSARMLERIHSLDKQNKQLADENRLLQESRSEQDSAEADKLVSLTHQLEEKKKELLGLQKDFTELEEHYLTLQKTMD